MSVGDENWQTTRPTIRERAKFVFNNDRLSDIKFVVRKMDGESESKQEIPAHKFVLSISSPVFEAMFYGELAETRDTIELPDCDYEGLLELFRYMYSDKANLSGSNIMGVLYLAKKYMVPSLAEECSKYLLNNLNPSNVFSILPSAQKYQEKDLMERCWKLIDEKTKEALNTDEFATIERSLLKEVITRDNLSVDEIDLFKAVDLWATEECKRQGVEAVGATKRNILGEEIVKAIRFPIMKLEDFSSVVLASDVLTKEEIVSLIRHLTSVSKSGFSETTRYGFTGAIRRHLTSVSKSGFSETTRYGFTGAIQRCCRFNSPPGGIWGYGGKPDVIDFTTDKDIALCGVRFLGQNDSNYLVDFNLKMVETATLLMSLERQTFPTKQLHAEKYRYSGFELIFSIKIILKKNTRYRITAVISGPNSERGWGGVRSVQCSGVTFKFMNSDIQKNNGGGVCEGQFPELLFCLE